MNISKQENSFDGPNPIAVDTTADLKHPEALLGDSSDVTGQNTDKLKMVMFKIRSDRGNLEGKLCFLSSGDPKYQMITYW